MALELPRLKFFKVGRAGFSTVIRLGYREHFPVPVEAAPIKGR